MSVATHPSARDTWQATGTLAYRSLLKVRHNPSRLFDVIALPVVSTALFAYVFGGAIAGGVKEYLPTLVPGVMVYISLTAAVVTGVQLCDDIDRGVFDRFRSLPIARTAPLIGALTADLLRYAIATTMTVLVGLVMGYRPHSYWGLAAGCLLVVVCAFALSWIFAFLGVVMSNPSTVQGLSMLVLTPLGFMSNALVPTQTMPGWVRTVADFNPVSKMCTAVRALADGHVQIEIVWSLVGAAIVFLVMMPITVRAYIRRG